MSSGARREDRSRSPRKPSPSAERAALEREAAVYRRERERREGRRPATTAKRAPLPVRILVGGVVRSVLFLVRAVRSIRSTHGVSEPAAVAEHEPKASRDEAGMVLRADTTMPARPARRREVRSRRARPAPRELTPAQRRVAERRRRLLIRRLQVASAIVLVALAVTAWIKVPGMEVFQIRHVEITGASAVPDLLVRRRIDPLLKGQTIFTVDLDRVRAEIADLPFVYRVQADRHLFGGLSLHVVEYEPLAFGIAGDGGWLVARDGRVLVRGRSADWRDRIPVVRLKGQDVKAGKRVGSEPALRLLRVIPESFPASVRTVEVGPKGLVATLHDGPEIRFGRDGQLTTKLLVAERLLTMYGPHRRDSIVYLDVSVPERPAARIES